MKLPKVPAVAGLDYRTAAVLIAGVVVLYFIAKREVKGAAAAVGGAVNPISRENIVARATNALVNVADGDMNTGPQTAGDWLYAVTHPDQYAKLAKVTKR